MSDSGIQAKDLSREDEQELDEFRERCQDWVALLLDRPIGRSPSIQQLHEAFDRWVDYHNAMSKRSFFRKKKEPAISPDIVAISLGTVLGDHIINATPLEWKLVTDSYGTCKRLYATGSFGEYAHIILDPHSMAMKRAVNKSHGWLEPTFHASVEHVLRATS